MKKLLLAFLLVSSAAFADVVVITDQSNAIYTMSENDDTVVPAGYKKTVIYGKTLEGLELTQSPDVYDFDGVRFKVNSARLKSRVDAEKQAVLDIEQKKADKVSAFDKLSKLGLSEDEIKAIVGE